MTQGCFLYLKAVWLLTREDQGAATTFSYILTICPNVTVVAYLNTTVIYFKTPIAFK